MQKARGGAFCLFRTGDWICQRKTYKLLGRRTRRFATASSSLSLWKLIDWNRVFIVKGLVTIFDTLFFWSFIRLKQPDGWLRASLGFSLFFIQKPKSPVKNWWHAFTSSSTTLFHQIHFHNEKGWSTQLRLTNHLYILFYLRPPRWPPWSLPPTEQPRLNDIELTRVLLLIL